MEKPWLPERWDKEADVVVVGFGAAGFATSELHSLPMSPEGVIVSTRGA